MIVDKIAPRKSEDVPPWDVMVTERTAKALVTLPQYIVDIYSALREELTDEGPMQEEWPHFEKPDKEIYRCHLRTRRDGTPVYVAYWRLVGKSIVIDICHGAKRHG